MMNNFSLLVKKNKKIIKQLQQEILVLDKKKENFLRIKIYPTKLIKYVLVYILRLKHGKEANRPQFLHVLEELTRS